jgi:hypothetical protein
MLMDRALPRPLMMPWLRLFGLIIMAAVVALNFYFLAAWLPWALRHGAWDYPIYIEAADRLFDGTMYDWGDGYIYPYSPVFAYLMAPFAALGGIGFAIWRLLHVAAVLTIPSWPVRIAILLSWPFLNDTWEGNVNTFLAVAGYWAIRHHRFGGWAFLAFAVVIPKPILLPGLAWLLWKEPVYRKGFAALVIGHGLLVLATGYAFDWPPALLGATHDMNAEYNFTPSVLIGWWWALVSLPLAAFLTWKGRIGWASVAINVYAAGVAFLLFLIMERRWPWWLTPPGISSGGSAPRP